VALALVSGLALCAEARAGLLPAGSVPAVIQLNTLDGATGLRLDGAAPSDESGFSVSAAGDINHDGIDDLLIGAPYAGGSGSVYVVFGRVGGFSDSVELGTLDGNTGFRLDGAAQDRSGWSMAGRGDVNGDGIDDLVIGAPYADANGSDSGGGYVVFGHAGAFPANLPLDLLDGDDGYRIVGAAEYDSGGLSVAIAGDVNGDGIDDLVIGAPHPHPHGNTPGSTWVVFGRSGSVAPTFDLGRVDGDNGFRVDGEGSYDYSGSSVAAAGDVNGDGFADLAIGAPGFGQSTGRGYVVFGHGGGFAPSLDLGALDGDNGFRLDGDAAGDYTGQSLAAAGDVNGDGIGDVVVGAPEADGNGTRSGSSFVVFGRVDGFAPVVDLDTLDGDAGFRIDGAQAGDRSGHCVAGAGDFNGDGVDDLLVGAYAASPNGQFSGSSYVVFGHAGAFGPLINLDSLSGDDGLRMDGVVASRSGWSVAGAGDFNGDGVADVAIGAPSGDPNGALSGESYVVFGHRPDRVFRDGFDGS
jgi:hypothetical protein